MSKTTTVERTQRGRVRRKTWRSHAEAWRPGPFKGNTKCNDVHNDDACQLRTGHKARHFGVNGSRWNHRRAVAAR